MNIETFVALAADYDRLGWAVQQQLTAVLDGADVERQNPNAMRMVAAFLERAAQRDVEGAAGLAGDIRRDLAVARETTP